MQNNPFHNIYHSIDSIHSLFYFINKSKLMEFLNQTDLLVLTIASLCHDIGHPGLNSKFLIDANE